MMSHLYIGRGRIIAMEQWGQDDIDMVVPGYIAFGDDNMGAFPFGTVEGALDYRIEPYNNTERLDFSWAGADEMDPVSGRGWAMIQEGQLQGRIFFHEGDDSSFVVVKESV
jgi:hypothetical protein